MKQIFNLWRCYAQLRTESTQWSSANILDAAIYAAMSITDIAIEYADSHGVELKSAVSAVLNKVKMDDEAKQEIVKDGLLSPNEAMRFLSFSKTKLYSLMQTGEIPYVILGGNRRIPRKSLLEYAASGCDKGVEENTE